MKFSLQLMIGVRRETFYYGGKRIGSIDSKDKNIGLNEYINNVILLMYGKINISGYFDIKFLKSWTSVNREFYAMCHIKPSQYLKYLWYFTTFQSLNIDSRIRLQVLSLSDNTLIYKKEGNGLLPGLNHLITSSITYSQDKKEKKKV